MILDVKGSCQVSCIRQVLMALTVSSSGLENKVAVDMTEEHREYKRRFEHMQGRQAAGRRCATGVSLAMHGRTRARLCSGCRLRCRPAR